MSVEAQKPRPEWFNKSLLEIALKSYHKVESLKIVNIKPTGNFIEHFGSEMLGCEVTYNSPKFQVNKTLNIVIKAFPSHENYKSKVLAESPFFSTEVRMYTETLPVINDLFQRSGLKCELAPE